MTTKISVNLNAIAQLRNRRDLPWPDVIGMGRLALEAGATGLTVHPRPDQRHTRFTDVGDLRRLITEEFPDREFNVEGYPSEDFLQLVEQHKPEQVTLVPDDPSQATSDHGWDFKSNHNMLAPIVERLHESNMRVSLFCDPDQTQISWANKTHCDRIELYTGPYAAMYHDKQAQLQELEKLGRAADDALAKGLSINAGHDLTVDNLPDLVHRIPDLQEVSVGHAITADALIHGLAASVKRYLKAVQTG
ncbi:MAG: pyridoxine 5'-phosphate synthase [Granulosicoccus sp.]